MPQWVKPWNLSNRAPSIVPVTLGPQLQWVRVGTPTFASFSAAAATSTVALFSLPAAAIIHGVKIRASVAFGGGSISAYTVSVGDAGTVDLYASAFNVYQAVGPTVFQLSSDFGGESLAAVTQINATANSTGGNLNTATTGSLDILCLLSIAK